MIRVTFEIPDGNFVIPKKQKVYTKGGGQHMKDDALCGVIQHIDEYLNSAKTYQLLQAMKWLANDSVDKEVRDDMAKMHTDMYERMKDLTILRIEVD